MPLRRARRGDVLSRLTPFVHCLKTQQLPNFCSFCVVKGKTKTLLKCANCKATRYCSKACQKEDWKLHKKECKCLQQVRARGDEVPGAEVRVMLRVLVRAEKGETALKCDELGLRCFKDLMSHADDIRTDPKRYLTFLFLYQKLERFSKGIFQLPGESSQLSEDNQRLGKNSRVDILLDIFGKITINSFELKDGISVGTAIYLSSSALDHSCEPDAAGIVNGAIQEIRAIRDFTYNHYSDIKVSYTSLLSTRQERRENLKEMYYFNCECSRCTVDSRLDQLLTSTRCLSEGCEVPILQATDATFAACDGCGNADYPADYEQSKLEATRQSKAILGRYENYHVTGLPPSEVFNRVTETIREVTKILHSYHVYVIRLRDVAFITGDALHDFQAALKYGREKIAPLPHVLPPGHPDQCAKVYEVGQMESGLGNIRQALRTVESVSEITYLVYGESHQMSQAMREFIGTCRLVLSISY